VSQINTDLIRVYMRILAALVVSRSTPIAIEVAYIRAAITAIKS
jgi:hypothetical protein